MAEKRDYYEVIGVSKSATADEIKKAYRKLAMEHHPDRNEGNKESEQKFKELTEAYSVLSDPDKRSKYDKFGHAAFSGGGGGGYGGSDGYDFGDLGDIFGSFFGGRGGFGGGSQRRDTSGADLRYNLEITLEEAAFGVEKEISFERKSRCETCSGSGGKPGTKKKTCSKCNGTGEIKTVSRSVFGQFVNVSTCDACKGKGQIPEEKCPKCNGSGLSKEKVTKKVKIPAGLDTGSKIRMSGFGEAGDNGGEYGDLYIYIYVKAHEIFEREENNIICEVPINFVTAILGGEVDVPTIDGSLKMKIPAGTQSGSFFRLKEKGITSSRGYGRGDQIVKIVVEIPKNLTEKQKDILKEFEKTFKEENNSMIKNFFEKISGKKKK